MDGKKRIARLRNAEKWKKLGLKGFGFFKAYKKDREVKAVGLEGPFVEGHGMVGDELKPMIIAGKPKKRRGLSSCCWKWREPEVPGLFGTAQRVIEKLEKKGFKRLGSGHYSTVLAKPGSDKVIKVTRHPDNWIDYVKWASEKGYAGGFAPRVYSWKKFPGGWSWAVMERMESTLGYSGHYNSYGEVSEGGEKDVDLIFSLLSHASNGNVMAQVYMEDLVPGAYAFVKELRSVMRASDIRGANTMVRKDGSLCFTDPCAGETQMTTTRLRSGDFSPSLWRFDESCYRYRSQPA